MLLVVAACVFQSQLVKYGEIGHQAGQQMRHETMNVENCVLHFGCTTGEETSFSKPHKLHFHHDVAEISCAQVILLC